MEYLTGYVWQKSKDCALVEGETEKKRKYSILLYQVIYAGRNTVFSCVCGNDAVGSRVTEELKSWFLERGEFLFGNKKGRRSIGKELKLVLKKWYREEIRISGILIVDQECWVILGKENFVCFFNRRFQKTHCKKLKKHSDEPLEILRADVQKSVGFLLGNREFTEQISKDAMLQCLAAQDIIREEQITGRLRELAEESKEKGYEGEGAAVYIKTE